MPSILFFSVIFIQLLFVFPTEAAGKNFLWKVSSPRATVHILGSIHLMKKADYPLAQTIEDAFSGSDILAVEADANNLGQLDVLQLMEGAFYTGDDGIERHIGRDTLERLRKEVAGLGLPQELFSRQRPWMLALTLTSMELMKEGFDPAYGIDMHFLSRAGGRKVVELESVAFQMAFFARLSDGEQEALLVHTLGELGSMRTETDAMVRAWKDGDTAAMERIASLGFDDPQMASLLVKLLDERNAGMSAKIESYLRAGGKYFVVVGAGHLVGSKGIIELLRRKGFTAEQM